MVPLYVSSLSFLPHPSFLSVASPEMHGVWLLEALGHSLVCSPLGGLMVIWRQLPGFSPHVTVHAVTSMLSHIWFTFAVISWFTISCINCLT